MGVDDDEERGVAVDGTSLGASESGKDVGLNVWALVGPLVGFGDLSRVGSAVIVIDGSTLGGNEGGEHVGALEGFTSGALVGLGTAADDGVEVAADGSDHSSLIKKYMKQI